MTSESFYLAVSRWPSHLPLPSHLSDCVCGTKNLQHPTSLVSLTCRTRSGSSEPGPKEAGAATVLLSCIRSLESSFLWNLRNLRISLIQPRLHSTKRNGGLSKIRFLFQRKSVVFGRTEKFSARFINPPEIKMRKGV